VALAAAAAACAIALAEGAATLVQEMPIVRVFVFFAEMSGASG